MLNGSFSACRSAQRGAHKAIYRLRMLQAPYSLPLGATDTPCFPSIVCVCCTLHFFLPLVAQASCRWSTFFSQCPSVSHPCWMSEYHRTLGACLHCGVVPSWTPNPSLSSLFLLLPLLRPIPPPLSCSTHSAVRVRKASEADVVFVPAFLSLLRYMLQGKRAPEIK